jgi:hypothetical protein
MNTSLPTPFAPWKDYDHYFLVPGGNFEGDLSGWTLNGGATIVSGNESYQVGSASDSRSLALPSGSTATTPTICVTADSPDLRMAVLNRGRTAAPLTIYVNYTDSKGQPKTKSLGDFKGTASASWTLIDPLVFLKPIDDIFKKNGQTTVSFTFASAAEKSSSVSMWQIDDLYVDPYCSR